MVDRDFRREYFVAPTINVYDPWSMNILDNISMVRRMAKDMKRIVFTAFLLEDPDHEDFEENFQSDDEDLDFEDDFQSEDEDDDSEDDFHPENEDFKDNFRLEDIEDNFRSDHPEAPTYRYWSSKLEYRSAWKSLQAEHKKFLESSN